MEDLFGRSAHHVRVIPERGCGLDDLEVSDPRFAGADPAVRTAIVLGGNVGTVPVRRRALAEVVRDAQHHVATRMPQQCRTQDRLTVVRDGLGEHPRTEVMARRSKREIEAVDPVPCRFEQRGDKQFVGSRARRVDLGRDNVIGDEAAVVVESVVSEAARRQSHGRCQERGGSDSSC